MLVTSPNKKSASTSLSASEQMALSPLSLFGSRIACRGEEGIHQLLAIVLYINCLCLTIE